MKLGELIDHLRRVKLDDVSALVEGAEDSLAGIETLARLFNQAQKIYAKKTWCLVDDSSALCTLTLTNGNDWVAYDRKVLRVLEARFSDTDVPLNLSTQGLFSPMRGYDSNYWDVNVSSMRNPGRPEAYALDGATYRIKFNRPLDATAAALTLKLRVARLPLVDLTADGLDSEPEIPDEHHLALCDFVAAEILSSPSMDADVRARGADFRKLWRAAIQEGKDDNFARTNHRGVWTFGAWGG